MGDLPFLRSIPSYGSSQLSYSDRLDILFGDPERLERLLFAEKARRGIPQGRLLFIGASDIAAQCWCSMKAVLKLREEEVGRFGQYLLNRLTYAYRLGLVTT